MDIKKTFKDFVNEANLNEGKFDGIADLVKALHFETDSKTAEEMKMAIGKSQGEFNKKKQIEGGEYSLRRFRKEIKFGDGTYLGVFLPGSYDAATSVLGDGPHKKAVKKVKWNQKKYDQWLEDSASNGGADNAFDMAQNAKNEIGLIDWVKKEFRGDDPLQRIQWDIEGFAESIVTEASDRNLIKQLTDTFGKFKLTGKHEIMMDSVYGGGSKVAVLRKKKEYREGCIVDTLYIDGGSNYEGYIELKDARSARPIPGKNKFDSDQIDDAMEAAVEYIDGIKESVTTEGKYYGMIAGDAASDIAKELSFYVKKIIKQSNGKVTYFHVKDQPSVNKTMYSLRDLYGIESQSGDRKFSPYKTVKFDNDQIISETVTENRELMKIDSYLNTKDESVLINFCDDAYGNSDDRKTKKEWNDARNDLSYNELVDYAVAHAENFGMDLQDIEDAIEVYESVVTEKITRGLKPLLTIGSTITKKAGEDALLDLSDKFDRIDDEYAGTIASWLDMAIELHQDGYLGDATKKLKQFNKACKDVLNGKEVGSAFESVTEAESNFETLLGTSEDESIGRKIRLGGKRDPGQEVWQKVDRKNWMNLKTKKKLDLKKWAKHADEFHMAGKDLQFESKVNEASRRKVHKAAKQGSYPAVIVVVQDGKVIHQEPVSTPDIAPATFNVMQEKYPKAVLHLEDNTGKRLFTESVNEAKAYKLKASEFGGDTHSAAYNVKGEPTWRVHSTYAIDQVSGENNPEERDVVFFEAMPINNDIYIKIGGINNLKRANGSTVGENFGTTIEEWKKDPKGIAKEASEFLTDATHLKWINKKARSEGQVIKWALKDDYASVIEDLVNKSLGLNEAKTSKEKLEYLLWDLENSNKLSNPSDPKKKAALIKKLKKQLDTVKESLVVESSEEAYSLHRLGDNLGQEVAAEFLSKHDVDLKLLTKAVQQKTINKYEIRDVVNGSAHKLKVKTFIKDFVNESSITEGSEIKTAKEIFDELIDVNGEEIANMDSQEAMTILSRRGIRGGKANKIAKELLKLTSAIGESVVNEASLSGIEFGNDDDIHPTKFKPLTISLKKNKVKMEVEKEEGDHGYPEVKLTGKRKDIEKVLADIWGPSSIDDHEDAFESVVNEGKMPDKLTNDDDIVFLKASENSKGAHYNVYYKGYDIDFGGVRFGTEEQLKSYAKEYILSRQWANKLRWEDAKPLPESVVTESKDEVDAKQLTNLQKDIAKINKNIKVYISNHPVTKGKLQIELGADHDNDNEIDQINSLLKKHTGDHKTGTMFNEDVIVEGKTSASYKDPKTGKGYSLDYYSSKKRWELDVMKKNASIYSNAITTIKRDTLAEIQEWLDGYKIDSSWTKGLSESVVNEAKGVNRAELTDYLEKHLKLVRTSEEFDGTEGGVWTSAENGEKFSGSQIFDYYSESSKYEFGVLNKFAKVLSKMGWYCEFYDPGTVMIWEE